MNKKELNNELEKLRNSEKHFRLLLDESIDPTFSFYADGTYRYVNNAFAKGVGKPLDEIIGRKIWDVFEKDEADKRFAIIKKVFTTGKIEEIEVRVPLPSGDTYYLTTAKPILNDFGAVETVICTSKNITKRVYAEKALRKSEEKYRDLVENMNEVIFIVDKSGFLAYVSPAVESILGYTPSEIIGKSIQEIIHKEDLQFVMARFQKALSGIKIPTEYRVYKKSGEVCWVYSSSNPIFDEKGVCGIQCLLTNIDDRKRAEEEKKGLEKKLLRSQKMEAIGLLAGGVAHDLNNVLSGVINYPELLLMNLPAESPMKKSLQVIMNSGLKAAAIVQDLLDLARRGVIVNEVLSLNDIISDQLRSPEHKKIVSYHPGVDIETHLEPDLLSIKGSPVHLKKAVMNLLSNAAEALSGGGRITVSTENRYVDRPIKGYDYIDKGDFVVLRIEDNGIGIAAEDLKNIFETQKKKWAEAAQAWV